MPKKITTSFNIDNTKSEYSKSSVFDRIIKEVDTNEIPTKYVDYIRIQYNDGNVVELAGKELSHPMPVNKNASMASMEEAFSKMKEVKIFVNIPQLESDVNFHLERLLGKYC
jgi:hypothetical protein